MTAAPLVLGAVATLTLGFLLQPLVLRLMVAPLPLTVTFTLFVILGRPFVLTPVPLLVVVRV